MNNPNPFINPIIGFQNFEQNQKNIEKILNKINRLEKDIRIVENRIDKLERRETKANIIDKPTDMYMI